MKIPESFENKLNILSELAQIKRKLHWLNPRMKSEIGYTVEDVNAAETAIDKIIVTGVIGLSDAWEWVKWRGDNDTD